MNKKHAIDKFIWTFKSKNVKIFNKLPIYDKLFTKLQSNILNTINTKIGINLQANIKYPKINE